MIDVRKIKKVFYDASELLELFDEDILERARQEIYDSPNWGQCESDYWDFEPMPDNEIFIDFCNTNELRFTAFGMLYDWHYQNTELENIANTLIERCMTGNLPMPFPMMGKGELREIAADYIPNDPIELIELYKKTKLVYIAHVGICSRKKLLVEILQDIIAEEVISVVSLYS